MPTVEVPTSIRDKTGICSPFCFLLIFFSSDARVINFY